MDGESSSMCLVEGEVGSWLRGVGKEMRCRPSFRQMMFFVYLEHESWTRKTMEISWTGNNRWKYVCSSDDQDSNGEI